MTATLTLHTGSAAGNSSNPTTVTVTPAANSLLIVAAAMDNGASGDSFTVTAPGLTFTKSADSHHSGCVQIWTAPVVTSAAHTISAARVNTPKTVAKRIYACWVTASDSAIPLAGTNAANNNDDNGGPPVDHLDLTATAAGSIAVMTALTVNAPDDVTGQTTLDNDDEATFGTEGIATWQLTAAATDAGDTLEISCSAGGAWECAALEIVPGTPSGSTNHGAAFFALI